MGKNVHATNTLPKQLLPDWHGRRKKGKRHDEPHAHMNIGSEPGGTHVNINWEYVIVPSPVRILPPVETAPESATVSTRIRRDPSPIRVGFILLCPDDTKREEFLSPR